MAKIKRPITVVGTSRGNLRAAQGIARGARPDALVLTSGFLTNASGSRNNVANILGSPAKLPKTLVIHHRNDGCRMTQPGGVAPFIKWSAGKARVVWLQRRQHAGQSLQAQIASWISRPRRQGGGDRSGILLRCYGKMANARAGKPRPSRTFGQVTTISAPVAGT